MKQIILVLLGAALGGVMGYFGFFWIEQQGFYAMVLPGGLVGAGACLARTRSKAVCIVCGLLALAISLFTEWRSAPFLKDASLGYFLTHIHQLRPITFLMITAGTFFGFWAPFSRRRIGSNVG